MGDFEVKEKLAALAVTGAIVTASNAMHIEVDMERRLVIFFSPAGESNRSGFCLFSLTNQKALTSTLFEPILVCAL